MRRKTDKINAILWMCKWHSDVIVEKFLHNLKFLLNSGSQFWSSKFGNKVESYGRKLSLTLIKKPIKLLKNSSDNIMLLKVQMLPVTLIKHWKMKEILQMSWDVVIKVLKCGKVMRRKTAKIVATLGICKWNSAVNSLKLV